MTAERERILQKIRRVQALAERGVAGERESATATLDRLMKQYGITEADIAEERREWAWFRYKTPIERKLLAQVIYAVTGRVGSGASEHTQGENERMLELNAPRRNGWKFNSTMIFSARHWKRKWTGSILHS